jgi:uncharacterized protein YccT (UPF0319 family)
MFVVLNLLLVMLSVADLVHVVHTVVEIHVVLVQLQKPNKLLILLKKLITKLKLNKRKQKNY